MVVAALADRDALIKRVAAIERLAQLENIAFALESDAELLADRAGAAVATGEIECGDLQGLIAATQPCRDAVRILSEVQELGAVAHSNARQLFGNGFQKRLQRVLGNQLVRLQRHRRVS